MRALLSVLVAVVLVVPARPSARVQLSDTELAERVAAAVRGYPNFGIFDDVSISVENRAVTLNGKVTMPYKGADIEARVRRIDGVRSVTNQLEPLPVSIADSDLRQKLAMAIYGHPVFRHYASMVNPPIHIVVEHSRVTLTGAVNSDVERVLAGSLAQVPGVLGVKNALVTDR
jgi:osmotically-inducible protein OsmY